MLKYRDKLNLELPGRRVLLGAGFRPGRNRSWDKAQADWRSYLDLLRHSGDPELDSTSESFRLQYSCSPYKPSTASFGNRQKGGGFFPCKRWSQCPFCAARFADDVYRRCRQVTELFGSPFVLVVKAERVGGLEEVSEALSSANPFVLRQVARKYADKIVPTSFGDVGTLSIGLSEDGEFQLRARYLAVMERHLVTTLHPQGIVGSVVGPGLSVSMCEYAHRPSRALLRKGVAAFAAYSRYHLDCDHVPSLVAYFRSIRKRRLFSYGGVLGCVKDTVRKNDSIQLNCISESLDMLRVARLSVERTLELLKQFESVLIIEEGSLRGVGQGIDPATGKPIKRLRAARRKRRRL